MEIRVLVVGGGVAGLATARALGLSGIEAHVIERSASSNHPGTGVYLPANAVRAIGELGLAGELAARAQRISEQRFLDHQGVTLFEVDLADFWKETGTCVALGHADLHQLLADGVPISTGRTVTALDQSDRVVATFDDGSRGAYDAVVGADGVRSWMRSAYLSGQAPRFLGQVSWRFVAHDAPDVPGWTVWLGRRATFLAVPLGGGRTYCFAAVDRRTPAEPIMSESEGLLRLFGGFAEPVPAMIRARRSQRQPYFSPVEEVVQQPWTRGRVALVGDAAHAMSPNMAEGVGMAVEDGLVLAETIATGRPLADFEARRRPRVDFVQAQTHRRDRARNLPLFVRDPVLSRLGPKIFRGNYQRLLPAP